MNFDLKTPCPECPFRSDIGSYLRRERAEEIIEALVEQDKTFTCHKTTVASAPDEEGFESMIDGPNAQHCAGALILLEKIDSPNQLMRIAERIGYYDRRKLDMEAPVFNTPEAFIEAQGERALMSKNETVGNHELGRSET